MRIHSKVSIDEDMLKAKIEELADDEILMLQIHSLYERMMEPYVPYLNGPLSRTAEVSPECVRYVQPYARRQYYGDDFNHTVEVHPLASARWNEAMLAAQGDVFLEQVQELISRRARQKTKANMWTRFISWIKRRR